MTAAARARGGRVGAGISPVDPLGTNQPSHRLVITTHQRRRATLSEYGAVYRVRRDPGPAERLAIAIRGRGALRRSKNELARWPGELERWHAFAEERHRGRARSWLAAAGYRVLPVDHRDA